MNSNNAQVKLIWFRWPILFSYPFLAFCRLLGYTKWVTLEKNNLRVPVHSFYLNRVLANLWGWFFVTDAVLHVFFRIIVPLKKGTIILCDRYIPDLIVDLICDTGDNDFLRKMPSRLLLSSIPRNSKLILIDVDEQTALSRKNDIPNITYLTKRRRLYLMLANILGMPILDGKKTITEVQKDLMQLLDLA